MHKMLWKRPTCRVKMCQTLRPPCAGQVSTNNCYLGLKGCKFTNYLIYWLGRVTNSGTRPGHGHEAPGVTVKMRGKGIASLRR